MGLTRPQFKIITLFALLTLGGVFPVQADENALHRAQFGSQSTLLAVIIDFERYRNGLGDRHLHQQLDTHLTRFRQHFETLSSIQPRLAEARRAALKQQWQHKNAVCNFRSPMGTISTCGVVISTSMY